ncbi:MAG: nucleotidyltransferase domain-containing protein [Candidatus Nanoarchaeia archaeon]|nr:nucleotidyltransferase domain-containing protein [Candidatus Nanoarchaeia archaeon]
MKNSNNSLKSKKTDLKKYPTLLLKSERDIAMDFATKVYKTFDKMIKSIVLFGSSAKHTNTLGSDIDLIIIIDDASIKFDETLVLWYREELAKILRENPYQKDFHINTVKLTTWWSDLYMGDPTVINVIRYGETLIDFGGFFNPLKILLEQGRIKPTPEAIYTCLNRVPAHILHSKSSELGSIEGCFWAMVDSAQALLMTIKVLPPSTEHIPDMLKEHFVDKKLLKMRYVDDFVALHQLHKKVMHGEIRDINGNLIDMWQDKAEEFFNIAMKIIKEIV